MNLSQTRYYQKRDLQQIKETVIKIPGINELRTLNNSRLKKLNETLDWQKNNDQLIYPSDFRTYEEKPVEKSKSVVTKLGVVKSEVLKVNVKAIDNILNFKANVPTAWSKAWRRNLQIKKDEITTKVKDAEPDEISD